MRGRRCGPHRRRSARSDFAWTWCEVQVLEHFEVDPGPMKPSFLGLRSVLEFSIREGKHHQIRRLVHRSGLRETLG